MKSPQSPHSSSLWVFALSNRVLLFAPHSESISHLDATLFSTVLVLLALGSSHHIRVDDWMQCCKQALMRLKVRLCVLFLGTLGVFRIFGPEFGALGQLCEAWSLEALSVVCLNIFADLCYFISVYRLLFVIPS